MDFLFAIGLMVVSSFISAALTPRTKSNVKPTAFEDFDIPQTEEGTPQEVLFGDRYTSSWTVLWYGNYRTQPIRRKA